MSTILLEIAVILGLILANGLFSMSEFALISSRRWRLKERGRRGSLGADAALRLSDDLDHFLPTVQVGVTLVGTLAGVLGGEVLSHAISQFLSTFPTFAPYAEFIGVAVVVLGITVATVVLGELLPKRLALSRPEQVASLLARPMVVFSLITIPFVAVLEGATDLMARLLGVPPSAQPPVTEEEIKVMIQEGTKAGVFEEAEHEIFKRVFRFCDRRARTMMTPRNEIVWIDLSDPLEETRRKVIASPYTRFPVCDESLDNLLGIVQAKDLLGHTGTNHAIQFKGMLSLPHFIYEGARGMQILELFKKSAMHTAIVLDEYGSVVGLLTVNDIVEAIVGDLPETPEEEEPRAVQRPDGSWLLDGRLPVDEFRDLLGLDELPEGDFHTLAGLVVTQLGHIPRIAESLECAGMRFEIVDMDSNRVDRVLVSPLVNHDRV